MKGCSGKGITAFALGIVGLVLIGPASAQATGAREREPIEPLPRSIALDPARVALGEKLFYDRRVSHDGAMSCSTCHDRARGGGDGLPRSINNDGRPGEANAPTIFNLAFNFRLNWNGRARTLEEQTESVLHNPMHINTSWAELLPRLAAAPEYAAAFREAYADGLRRENVIDAITTFERSLITPNASFDRFLRGEKNALSADELQGYRQFKAYGCVACHQGINIGGNLFQKFGHFGDYFARRGGPISKADLGRYAITGREKDRHVFRVPSLRNVAVTGPYLHDGSVETLEEMVRIMARVQLGRTLAEEDVRVIVRFLHTLTGEYLGRPLARHVAR